MWKKINPPDWSNREAKLAIGHTILSRSGRIFVDINKAGENKGSTLRIDRAKCSDKGDYVCQLVENTGKQLKHSVLIRKNGQDICTPKTTTTTTTTTTKE